MKIAVVAANGRTGRIFTELALNAGHQIVAGIRGSHNFNFTDRLELIEDFDATNSQQVSQLVVSCDAVVSLIGHSKNSTPDVQTTAVRNLISAMNADNVSRLVSLTGTGVRFSPDRITFLDKLLNFSIKLIDPKRIADGKNHAAELMTSQLDWTIIRVLKLTNGTAKSFSLLENGPAKTFVSRAEVAKAILEIIEQESFIKKAPIIGKSLT